MTNAEILLRRILGSARCNIRPLALAVEITGNLLFVQRISMDDIQVTKHVYPDVARLLHQKTRTAAKSVERLAHRCWDSLEEQGLTAVYLGRPVKRSPTPAEMLTYLAVYACLDAPFFSVVDENPCFLFQTPADMPRAPLPDALPDAIRRSVPAPVTQTLAFPSAAGGSAFPVCPACLVTLEREGQHFCDRCGQCLDWSRYRQAHTVFPK